MFKQCGGIYQYRQRLTVDVEDYFHAEALCRPRARNSDRRPWEIDPEQPRLDLGARSRFLHYTNLHKMESRHDELLRTYAFAPLGKLPEHTRDKAGSSTSPSY